ncbi:hypothetical protein HanRHA438_Chr06g0251411 [Helianthus annuus]|nr:hypothetical protein HanRHA438_Chr06g0251411 [Helianthus annuus]
MLECAGGCGVHPALVVGTTQPTAPPVVHQQRIAICLLPTHLRFSFLLSIGIHLRLSLFGFVITFTTT